MPHLKSLNKAARPLMAWASCALVVALSACNTGPTPPQDATPTTPAEATATVTQPLPGTLPTDTPSAPANTPTTLPSPTAEPATPTIPVETPTEPPQATVTAAPMPSYTWQRKGLDGESLRDIALLPGGNNLVLASSPDGVWRSQYDYTIWDKVSVPLQGSDPPPGIVALTIGSPDVMYAAAHTGCASGLPMNSFRSTDGGQTWTPMQPEIVAINASNGGVAYAALCTGIIKTTDSGATWSDVLPGSHNDNRDPYGVVSSPDGEQVYAAYASEGGVGMMKRSTDGGQTWQDVTPKNAPDNELRAAVLMMFVPGSVGRPDDGGLYMTNSQGAWFLPLESDDWQFHASQGNSDPQTQYYPTALFVDTAYTAEYDKPGPVLYEARSRFTEQGPEGLGVFRSTDLGATWQQIGDDLGKRTVTRLALAPHDTAANPAMVETLLATTSDGVWAIPMPPPFR